MSGKTLSSKTLAYRCLMWVVVGVLLLGAAGCGDSATPTAVSQVLPTGPADTATPASTSTPVPSPTPTEIPIVLPTATPPRPNLPATAVFYNEAFTPAPTTSPVPTSLPAPSVTPYVPPKVFPLSIYQVPIFNYAALDRVLPPAFTTQCINEQHFIAPTPTPLPTPTPVPSGVLVVIQATPTPSPTPAALSTPVVALNLKAALPNAWVTSFNTKYFSDARRNSIRIAAPTFTPVPSATPIPTATPLPYPTPDVFGGQTVRPAGTAAPPPAPTRVPPVPTSTPSLSLRYQQLGSISDNFVQSVFISDVTAFLVRNTAQPTNFTVMWHVMNDIILGLANVDTPMEVHLRAYEQYLDKTINFILTRSLADARLAPTGEERYTNRKIIIGNVPDLRAFRYLKPCFTDERIQQAQNQYNALINRVVAKYPNRVYVADLTRLNWVGNPQWVTPENGYELTQFGADAVADAFGAVFDRILPGL